jgi:DNA-binding transcriptional MerR regulator
VDKSSDAFRTISEVAIDLDLPQHVLRFWETRFSQIKPLKRGGGRRYYRPDDVDLLKGIRHLLYGEGYTIKGVQRILKEQGVRFVMTLWQEGAPAVDAGARDHADDGSDDDYTSVAHEGYAEDDEVAGASDPQPMAGLAPIDLPATPLKPMRPAERWSGSETGLPYSGAPGAASPLERAREAALGAARTVSLVPMPSDGPSRDIEGISPETMAQRFAPRSELVRQARATDPVTSAQRPAEQQAAPIPRSRETAPTEWGPAPRQPPFQPMLDRFRSVASRLSPEAARVATPETGPEEPSAGLSRDDVRRLQSTLFELLECKRLLDQAR